MSFADVRRLRTFTLVLDLGSVSAAAAVLGYTQSAASQQLAALERDAGSALVDRSRRPFRPTAAGARLRPHADRILAAVAAADAAAADLHAGQPRRLRLAAFPSALSGFVATAVRDLRRAGHDAPVQVLQLETREAVAALRGGHADLAIVHHMPGLPAPSMEGLRRQHLLDDELCVVLPERHRLARADRVRVADLEDEPLVAPRRDAAAAPFRSVVEHLCAEAGFTPHIAYEVDDLVAAQAFAATGIAAVLMHRLTILPALPGAVARPLAPAAGGCRAVEALVADGARDDDVDRLLRRLVAAAPQASGCFSSSSM